MSNRIEKQTGIVILTVMLIIFLMVTLVAYMVEDQQLLIRRMSNQSVAEQGYQYSLGVEQWAMRILHDDVNRAIDYWQEDWAFLGAPLESENDDFDLSSEEQREPLPKIDFGIDTISLKIIDLQGRYNLNNLANKQPAFLDGQKQIFTNLLELVEVEGFEERERLFNTLVDWLDENDAHRAGSVESNDYKIKPVPYYAADQLLTSLGELRFVEGFDTDLISKLENYVTVLPVDNARININTASSQVLAALSTVPVIDLASVDAFLQQRTIDGFPGFDDSQISAAQNAIIGVSPASGTYVRNMLQTSSRFFQIQSRIEFAGNQHCSFTVVLRQNADPNSQTGNDISVMRREQSSICDEIVH